MKNFISILFLVALRTVSFSQDTAYISKDKTTALFFNSAVKVIGKRPADFDVLQKESGLITLKALKTGFTSNRLYVQEIGSAKIYHITVKYSYGRAGRRIEIGRKTPLVVQAVKVSEINNTAIAKELAYGKRKNIVDHKRSGDVKAWVNKLSLAGNKIFFRLDIRNKSKLPYNVDFIRFYIRDLKTVARMATHEQEIVPVYSTLGMKTVINNNQEIVSAFSFFRFSLSQDQALEVELYERNGNRHLYLQIKQKDLDDLTLINPAPQQPASSIVAVNTIN